MIRYITLIIIFSALVLVPNAFANSSSSVNINNNINSTSTSDSNINSHTDVTVETNGEVTHYSSDEPNQKVEVKSVNGESSIKVNGEEVSSSPTKTLSKTPTPTPYEEINPTPSPILKIEEIIKEKFSFVQKFFSFLDSLRK